MGAKLSLSRRLKGLQVPLRLPASQQPADFGDSHLPLQCIRPDPGLVLLPQ